MQSDATRSWESQPAFGSRPHGLPLERIKRSKSAPKGPRGANKGRFFAIFQYFLDFSKEAIWIIGDPRCS